MTQSTATRRLVKSPPELWAELSSEDSLNRHLAAFGEIRITRVKPETTVAWEGDRASGTVELAPTGRGASIPGPPSPAPDPAPPAPTPDPSPIPPPAPDPVPPTPSPQPPPPPQIKILDPDRTVAILTEVLDDLGAAHHRPFSRD